MMEKYRLWKRFKVGDSVNNNIADKAAREAWCGQRCNLRAIVRLDHGKDANVLDDTENGGEWLTNARCHDVWRRQPVDPSVSFAVRLGRTSLLQERGGFWFAPPRCMWWRETLETVHRSSLGQGRKSSVADLSARQRAHHGTFPDISSRWSELCPRLPCPRC